MITQIKSALQDCSIPKKKEFLPKFFKAGKAEYAEGDQFIDVTVPDQRIVAKEFGDKISLIQLEELLSSPIHDIVIVLYSFWFPNLKNLKIPARKNKL